ncbi:MAG TPA: winged helix-turn-helix domain-containing protein [Blastocatellia bacterium]|jgi:Tol biopolymer transport system component/DNA-binding winged helix-turn-helix (wHTH) protein|nr:winged helix-turn-helix domain-containing protein [Blastocatellia bacterium]
MNEKTLCYQFDDVRVDLRTFKVWRKGALLPIEPKAFETLVFLIDRRGRLVEKNEMLDAIWKDTFVTPNALTRVIAHLRRTLGDDAKEAKYIETVKTRGYRFIAEVQVNNESAWIDEVAESETLASINDRNVQIVTGHSTTQAKERLLAARPLALICAGFTLLLLLAIILLWEFRTWFVSVEQTAVLRTAQITTTPGLDLFPAFSPDGDVIAYSSLRNGKFEIFARQLAPGGREIQVTSDGAQNLQPAWSPDGKLIAYHSRERRGVWTVPAFGGVARQLTEFGADPAWSPDGEWIAFQSGAPADLGQAAFGAMPPSTIWIVPARGGAPRQITKIGAPPGGHSAVTWSPDGKRIVFVTYDIGLSEVWSVSPKGDDLKRLLGGKNNFFDPVFSPDGRYLFLSTAWGNFCLWRQRLSPVTGLPEGELIQLANTGAALARYLTIAPDGKRVAYSSLTLNDNIGSVTLDTNSYEAKGESRLLTQDTNYRKSDQYFSPDGKTIVYSVWRMGTDDEVWLVDADGGNPRQLTVEPAAVLGWLPTGDQVALSRHDTLGTQFLKVDVNSGKQTLLCPPNLDVRMGRLAPDGRRLAFNSRAGGAINVWTLALADGTTKQLTFDQEMMGFPCWSPDGQDLAFEVKRGDDTHIAMIPSDGLRDGGSYTQLTFDRGQSWPGSWSPGGDKIAFAGQRDGVWNIWWVSRDGRAQKRVTNYTKLNIYVRYPAWSPRGNQIVYEYAETTGNIWMMELK